MTLMGRSGQASAAWARAPGRAMPATAAASRAARAVRRLGRARAREKEMGMGLSPPVGHEPERQAADRACSPDLPVGFVERTISPEKYARVSRCFREQAPFFCSVIELRPVICALERRPVRGVVRRAAGPLARPAGPASAGGSTPRAARL